MRRVAPNPILQLRSDYDGSRPVLPTRLSEPRLDSGLQGIPLRLLLTTALLIEQDQRVFILTHEWSEEVVRSQQTARIAIRVDEEIKGGLPTAKGLKA
jgi:hypothetical protein